MYRQGDLLIVAVNAAPRGQYARDRVDGVIQEGEATGHAHRLVGGAAWDERGETFLTSDGSAVVTHDEHDTIVLPEGTYKVLRQREFTPEGERRVRD